MKVITAIFCIFAMLTQLGLSYGGLVHASNCKHGKLNQQSAEGHCHDHHHHHGGDCNHHCPHHHAPSEKTTPDDSEPPTGMNEDGPCSCSIPTAFAIPECTLTSNDDEQLTPKPSVDYVLTSLHELTTATPPRGSPSPPDIPDIPEYRADTDIAALFSIFRI